MTDQENTRLREVLKTIVPKIRRDRDRRMSEEDTKIGLIDPVLEALGWNVRDWDEVHHEYRAKAGDNPVDYALKISAKPRLLIEAKALGENLADRKWVIQVLTYATAADVEWLVLSDGDEYRFYKSTARGEAEEKEFCRIRLSEATEDDAVNALALLSRSNLDGPLIVERATAHFVDRRVKAALRELLNPPEKGLVKLIHTKVPDLSPKEIIASLDRLDIKIDSKVLQQGSGGDKGAGNGAGGGGGAGGLAELIQAGILTASTKLFAQYKGRDFEATVLADGEMEFQGKRYDTPSAAGVAAKSTVTGKEMPTNGWDFWQVRDSGGQVHKLGDLRGALKGKEA
jgi:hypothetical protein